MFKKTSLLILFIPLWLSANMASPLQLGTLVTSPFTSKYVAITHENIAIKINRDFSIATYTIEYHIYSEKKGLQIPLLFYASEYLDDFTVTIDGLPVTIKPYNIGDVLTNFDTIFNAHFNENLSVKTDDYTEQFSLNKKDFLYFETAISEGNHVIKVTYKATPWSYDETWLTNYTFRYALAPAKYWKSFGSLQIVLDATEFKNPIKTNLGNVTNGDLNTLSKWTFDELPSDFIEISFNPKMSTWAQFLISMDTFGISLFISLFLVLVHFYAISKYRKKNLKKTFSPVVLIGSFIIPFLFVADLVFAYALIDNALGKYANGRRSYGLIYNFFMLPIYCICYLLIALMFDFFIKLRIKRSRS